MMYVHKIDFGTPEYDETVQLRTKILRKPLGLEFTSEQLAKEWSDIHLGCYSQQNELLGCMIFTKVDDQTLKMRQVAVDDSVQGKGVGSFFVKASEQFALQNGFTKIEMHARETAIPFYEKLGYKKVGKRFEEVTIPHFKMEKKLA